MEGLSYFRIPVGVRGPFYKQGGVIMLDSIYQFLAKLGYSHPIHPTEVHIPIGLVVGALVFAVVAAVFRRERLLLTPRHCLILSLIWVFPTVLFGIMDWQHFYHGAWLFPIKVKLVMAPVLIILLVVAIILGHKYGATSKATLFVYFLCFCSVVVLGYFGGQLVFGNSPSGSNQQFMAGQKIFVNNCSGCHPHGGNILKPDLPLKGSPKLADFETFLSFIRDPMMPQGSKGEMPAFTSEKVSDQDAKALYAYITHILE